MSLKELKEGQKATIISLPFDNDNYLHKILAMGLLPGVEVEKIIDYPAIVIDAGYSRFSLDSNLGSEIKVKQNIIY
ncbi:ferrous iron transport protein A [Candidatus Riflebacteria bacterium]